MSSDVLGTTPGLRHARRTGAREGPAQRHEAFPGAAFWQEAFAIHGAATNRILVRTLVFALVAAAATVLSRESPGLAVPAGVMEASGLVLGLLLVFRTAAGYERWWEARKLWGILNQSRNLVVAARAYGPSDPTWQSALARWVVAFAHATRAALRDSRDQRLRLRVS